MSARAADDPLRDVKFVRRLTAAMERAWPVCGVEYVERLVRDPSTVKVWFERGCTALHFAAIEGDEELVGCLLRVGSSANVTGHFFASTLMNSALTGGHLRIAELLVAHGASVSSQDHAGRTALIDASADGYVAAVEFVLAHGADVRHRDRNGSTALVEAARKGASVIDSAWHRRDHAAVVRLLLDHGADPHSITRSGETPASVAAGLGCADVLDLLCGDL